MLFFMKIYVFIEATGWFPFESLSNGDVMLFRLLCSELLDYVSLLCGRVLSLIFCSGLCVKFYFNYFIPFN